MPLSLLLTYNENELPSGLVGLAAAKALTTTNPQFNLGHIDLNSYGSAKNLFKRMSLTKQISTIGKIEMPAGAQKESDLLFMHKIVALAEEHNISLNLIMNLDQTPSK